MKILQWLVYSLRPLRIEEIVEVIAVDPKEHPRFDPDRRFLDPDEVLAICPSLITLVFIDNPWGDDITEVKLAHFSVKEYLVSERVHDSWYSIQEMDAHLSIAEICVAYLVHFQCPVSVLDKSSNNPLRSYATDYWAQHARIIDGYNKPSSIIEEFVLVEKAALHNWALSCIWPKKMSRPSGLFCLSSYHLSACGLSQLVRLMLENGAHIKAQPYDLQPALYEASSNGHERVVTLLLKNGADVNAQLEESHSTLYMASANGHEAVVKLLLKNGVDVNAQLENVGTALYIASWKGHKAVVKLLLENSQHERSIRKF